MSPDASPLALRAALEATAGIERTRCGAGTMVWRRWGEGPALVLLHGGAGGWDHWVRNIGPLSVGRTVWCPDLPALGESDVPTDPVTLEAIVAATADGLDRVLSPGAPVDVAGFSFGALVGALVCAARPGRVRRLVLIGAASLGLPDPALALRFWRWADDEAGRLAIHRANLHALMLASTDDDPEVLALYAQGVERARFFGKAVAARPLLRDALPALDVGRVDAIYGALDAVTGRRAETARHVLRAVRPELRFETIEGAGHWVQYERPREFEAALLRQLIE